ncbi:MAG: hypothetical protein COA97_11775 [Flavobacteriales bacterium]|nr:MAG: hypothetical protein COA97_11775 [Flavobacteriales bacterium]
MLRKILFTILCFTAIFCSKNTFSQEVSPERNSEYTFTLNKIKFQEQVDSVTFQTEAIKEVNSCKLDWLNYKMVVLVKEGGTYGVLSLEKIKAILNKNNVALINFTKKEIK